jgi:hypothetical protein
VIRTRYSRFTITIYLEFSSRDLLDHESLDLVLDFDVVKINEADTTFEALSHLARVVFESLQRRE